MEPHVLLVEHVRNWKNVCSEKLNDNNNKLKQNKCRKNVTQNHWIHMDTSNCIFGISFYVLRSSFFFHFPNGIYTCVGHYSSCHDFNILPFFIVNWKFNLLSNFHLSSLFLENTTDEHCTKIPFLSNQATCSRIFPCMHRKWNYCRHLNILSASKAAFEVLRSSN